MNIGVSTKRPTMAKKPSSSLMNTVTESITAAKPKPASALATVSTGKLASGIAPKATKINS